jgi:hypothetical protein
MQRKIDGAQILEWRPAESELLDERFDAEGILYSGKIPAPQKINKKTIEEGQHPLSARELQIRNYWHSRRDPIILLQIG